MRPIVSHAKAVAIACLVALASNVSVGNAADGAPAVARPAVDWYQNWFLTPDVSNVEATEQGAPEEPKLPDPDVSKHRLAQANPPLEPIPSSQEVPFTASPDVPAASNAGNSLTSSVSDPQDLSNLRPGNFLNTKYRWYGFVRLDAIYDFKPIASTDDFVTSSIPIPQGHGQNTVLTPRYTRFGFDTETPWEAMDWKIKTRIEVDFFNGNTSGAFGSFPLRLRFAWIDFGPFTIGQAASVFMDYSVFPNVLDYEGPPGMVLMRQPLISVHYKFWEKFKATLGVEQPYSDIQWFANGAWNVNPNTGIIPGSGSVLDARNIQNMPDFTGSVRYEGDYGHLQVAGVLRKLTFQPAVGPDLSTLGYGTNVTGSWYPWAMLHQVPRTTEDIDPLLRSHFMGQFAAGRGIERYIQDVNGMGLDATFDPVNGFRALPCSGWFVAYEQWWAKRWASNFTVGGATHIGLTDTLPDNTYKSATYYSANLIWLPVDRMGVGLEYLYGTREDKNGQFGTAHRLQAGVQYRF